MRAVMRTNILAVDNYHPLHNKQVKNRIKKGIKRIKG